MNPLQRLREAAQAFRQAEPEEQGWFDKSLPDCRRGEKLLNEGKPFEAENCFRQAAEAARRSSSQKRQRPRILLALATAQWKQDKLQEAAENAEAALALLSEKGGTCWELGETQELLGRLAWNRGGRDQAIQLLRSALASALELRDVEGVRLVARQRVLAGFLRENGLIQEADEELARALQLAEQRCGTASGPVADCLIDRCRLLFALNRQEELKALGDRALTIRRALCGNGSMEVAHDLESLAGFCQEARDFEQAVHYLEQSLRLRDKLIGGDTSEFASLLTTLADVYTVLGRIAPALELMQQAVGKLGPARDANLAAALEKLGSMYVHTGRNEDALDCYQQARKYWQAHPGEGPEPLEANSRALQSLVESMPEEEDESADQADVPDSGVSVLLPTPAAAARAPGPPLISSSTPPAQPPAPAFASQPAGLTTTSQPLADPPPLACAVPLPPAASPQPAPAPGSSNNVRIGLASPTGAPTHPDQDDSLTLTLVTPTSGTPAARMLAVTPNPEPRIHPEPRSNGWEDLQFELIRPAKRPQ